MKKTHILKLGAAVIISALSFSTTIAADKKAKKTEKVTHGEYQDWRLLSVSHRTDKNTLRAILGNDKAIAAARTGKTKPWADGVILAKLIWKERAHPNWAAAIVPSEFSAAEAMIKDSKKYASTGGWGFGHWVDGKLKMHPKEKSEGCFACHTAVTDNDYVFTFPALK